MEFILRNPYYGFHEIGSIRVSGESALMVAENSVFTVSVFYGLVGNFGFCICIFCVTKDSVLIAQMCAEFLC